MEENTENTVTEATHTTQGERGTISRYYAIKYLAALRIRPILGNGDHVPDDARRVCQSIIDDLKWKLEDNSLSLSDVYQWAFSEHLKHSNNRNYDKTQQYYGLMTWYMLLDLLRDIR